LPLQQNFEKKYIRDATLHQNNEKLEFENKKDNIQ